MFKIGSPGRAALHISVHISISPQPYGPREETINDTTTTSLQYVLNAQRRIVRYKEVTYLLFNRFLIYYVTGAFEYRYERPAIVPVVAGIAKVLVGI